MHVYEISFLEQQKIIKKLKKFKKTSRKAQTFVFVVQFSTLFLIPIFNFSSSPFANEINAKATIINKLEKYFILLINFQLFNREKQLN